MAMEKIMKIVLVKERKSSIYRERVSVKLKVIFFLNAQQREKFTFSSFYFRPLTHTLLCTTMNAAKSRCLLNDANRDCRDVTRAGWKCTTDCSDNSIFLECSFANGIKRQHKIYQIFFPPSLESGTRRFHSFFLHASISQKVNSFVLRINEKIKIALG